MTTKNKWYDYPLSTITLVYMVVRYGLDGAEQKVGRDLIESRRKLIAAEKRLADYLERNKP